MPKNSLKLVSEILILLFIASSGLALGFILALKITSSSESTNTSKLNTNIFAPAPPPLADNTTNLSGIIATLTPTLLTLEDKNLQINLTPETIIVKIDPLAETADFSYEVKIETTELKVKDAITIETTESSTGKTALTAKKIILLNN